MDRYELAGFMNPRQLQLIILPTEQCNFRCTYCYEDFEIGQMKDETVTAIKRLLVKRIPRLESLHVSWFGGEPLMAKQIVTDINELAREQCLNAGVSFSSAMTTNAYGLDSATFDALAALDVRDYQVSIDGAEDTHNQTRKLISGRGTFERIWNNLLALRGKEQSFKVILRLHVHQNNIESMRRLLPAVHEAFSSDTRFTVFIKAVGDWGGDSVKQMSLVGKSSDVIAELNDALDALGWFEKRRSSVGGAASFSPCYAARPNSFVIRADGSLAKCTVAFSDPRNRVGQIDDDGTLRIDSGKIHQFMRGFKSLQEKELHCPMNGMPRQEEIQVVKFERKPRIEAVAAVQAG